MVQTAPATQGENGGMFQKQDDIRINDPVDPGGNNVTLKLPCFLVILYSQVDGVTCMQVGCGLRFILSDTACGQPPFHPAFFVG